MSFRTVVIGNRCKLDLRMNYMEVRGVETKKIFIDDIDTLIIENPAVSFTGCLLEALIEKKVKVIFCDSRRNPQSELTAYYGSHDTSKKVKRQISWTDEAKGNIWTSIVAEKINKQSEHLYELGFSKEGDMLQDYIEELQFRDETNREGHAAKVYFNKVFGMDFTRGASDPVNSALDYGYSLILSIFNREITANGYITQLGLFHDNMFNQYNLSSDLMEPYRVLVDRKVKENQFDMFGPDEKKIMLNILTSELRIKGTRQVLSNAIRIYVKSVFDALAENDPSMVLTYEL